MGQRLVGRCLRSRALTGVTFSAGAAFPPSHTEPGINAIATAPEGTCPKVHDQLGRVLGAPLHVIARFARAGW
jgi:hypothetical protein